MNDGYVLEDVKNSIGPMMMNGDTGYDNQILGFIEIELLPLYQLGCLKVLSEDIDEQTLWSSIISPPTNHNKDNAVVYAAIRKYVGLKARLFFDPPPSNVMEIFKSAADELFWRIQEAYENDG